MHLPAHPDCGKLHFSRTGLGQPTASTCAKRQKRAVLLTTRKGDCKVTVRMRSKLFIPLHLERSSPGLHGGAKKLDFGPHGACDAPVFNRFSTDRTDRPRHLAPPATGASPGAAPAHVPLACRTRHRSGWGEMCYCVPSAPGAVRKRANSSASRCQVLASRDNNFRPAGVKR